MLCALLACALAMPARAGDNDAVAAVKRMGRGVNILGYDGLWNGYVDDPFRMSDFALIREAGFRHVRINFHGFKFMDARDRLDPAVLAKLDQVIATAARIGLTPVLDQHDNRLCQTGAGQCRTRLVAFWRQIAARYAGQQPQLVYEILNEPGGDMSAAAWNTTLQAALKAIRAADPGRVVIAAALNAGNQRDIEKLDLPAADRRLIVTVHYYDPSSFTHQGAPWEPGAGALHDVDWGTDAERVKVIEDLRITRDWALKQDRPVYLGEFGVYDKAPTEARAAWAGHLARTAESFGWAWAYWQFDHDFALFDSRTHSWKRPLLDALMAK